jgi:hypothetical protein
MYYVSDFVSIVLKFAIYCSEFDSLFAFLHHAFNFEHLRKFVVFN